MIKSNFWKKVPHCRNIFFQILKDLQAKLATLKNRHPDVFLTIHIAIRFHPRHLNHPHLPMDSYHLSSTAPQNKTSIVQLPKIDICFELFKIMLKMVCHSKYKPRTHAHPDRNGRSSWWRLWGNTFASFTLLPVEEKQSFRVKCVKKHF